MIGKEGGGKQKEGRGTMREKERGNGKRKGEQ
jgi:hypothetical protein